MSASQTKMAVETEDRLWQYGLAKRLCQVPLFDKDGSKVLRFRVNDFAGFTYWLRGHSRGGGVTFHIWVSTLSEKSTIEFR